MGYLRTSLSAIALAALAACGSDSNTKVDAAPPPLDAPPDAAPDAPPDGPSYDFSCAANPLPTTAPPTITLGGTVTAGQQGGLVGAEVQIFKRGMTPPLQTTTSGAGGAWTSTPIATMNVPFDGYIHASMGGPTIYRSGYVFPPQPFPMSITQLPTPVVPKSTFDLLGSGQDDTNNGAILVLLFDCANAAVNGATLSAKQNTTAVGDVVDASGFLPGLYLILNVPAGDVIVSASINGQMFRDLPMIAFKKTAAGTPDANGTVSSTIMRPGPL